MCGACRSRTPQPRGKPASAQSRRPSGACICPDGQLGSVDLDCSSVLLDQDLLPRVMALIFEMRGLCVVDLSAVCRFWRSILREALPGWRCVREQKRPLPRPHASAPKTFQQGFSESVPEGLVTTCFGGVDVLTVESHLRTVNTGLFRAAGLAADQDHLFLTNTNSPCAVLKLNLGTYEFIRVAPLADWPEREQLNCPQGLARDRSSGLWVADMANDRVVELGELFAAVNASAAIRECARTNPTRALSRLRLAPRSRCQPELAPRVW